MLKNSVQPDRPEMTTWHMHIVCWITKAIDIHSEYVIRIAFFHCSNGSMDTPQCYVMCTFPFLFVLTTNATMTDPTAEPKN